MKLIYIALMLASPFANACMGFGDGDAHSYTLFPNDETAVLIWDQKNGVEHFIRQAKFKNAPKNFAFVVPVPSTPDLEEAPRSLLDWIRDELYQPKNSGPSGSSALGGGGGSFGGVEVIKQQEVAGMNASVIRSTDANALRTWLTSNGYSTPKQVTPWIEHYVNLKWEFVAFKIKSETTPEKPETESPWVRISFKTPRLFYPYRESELRKAIPGRDFNLFVIAPTKVVGSFESIKPWTTTFNYAASYYGRPFAKNEKSAKAPNAKDLAQYLTAVLGQREPLIISHFRNREELRPLDEDLFFDPLMTKE